MIKMSGRLSILLLLLVAAVVMVNAARPEDVLEFGGDLQEGSTYRAAIARGQDGEWRTSVPLKILRHHAARIEWLNLKEYPELDKPQPRSRQKQIVFTVVKRETLKVAGQYRWNTTYYCRITAAT
ncbi:MAG: hypothetical protein QOF02_1212 [Blastocatellia bacterium]|jgi:hypothetical protein|nr:hypothetical protein [Blastocatellia bacterium]